MTKVVLLDDCGMNLMRDLFTAYEDFCVSVKECPEWREMNMAVAERKIQIYREDLIPRLHASVDRTTDLIAHYLILHRSPDIEAKRYLQWHLLIDSYAHQFIERTRRKLEQWNTVSEEASIVGDLVIVLRKLEQQSKQWV